MEGIRYDFSLTRSAVLVPQLSLVDPRTWPSGPHIVRAFRLEAQSTAQLRSPHILTFPLKVSLFLVGAQAEKSIQSAHEGLRSSGTICNFEGPKMVPHSIMSRWYQCGNLTLQTLGNTAWGRRSAEGKTTVKNKIGGGEENGCFLLLWWYCRW